MEFLRLIKPIGTVFARAPATSIYSKIQGNSYDNFIQRSILSADGEGFEPPVPFGTPVFKTGAIDHSATHPTMREF
jgi:hypothetical protein